ncbi:NAD(P)H-hydrate dehydratase [Ruegeria conchae]|uniref:NAD(P)H-hydrate dehydratase n=1 Tax=Ruegeria conchae TaxID=981384 RepID=UPI0021A7B958|nr:NAD(P)H-hydrate dehydratase [Ruegeria conchae]UWR01532.1 NAD(P)H-hydrate dehydratase [Ruegeria conchae]
MTKLLTAAQMRLIETTAIGLGQATGLELMERAGQGVVAAIFEEWPDLAKSGGSAVILSGPGNNGGDGFVVARLLQRQGWQVEVLLYGDPAKLPPDARLNYERWEGRTLGVADFGKAEIQHPDLSIDALFGTGLTRPIEDPVLWEYLWAHDDAEDAWEMRRQGRGTDIVPPRTVAIDLPSGLCSDSGKVIGGAFAQHGRRCARSALTVSFHARKLGHVLSEGSSYCGRLVVKDIGLNRDEGEIEAATSVEAPSGTHLNKSEHSHKYSHGHALVLSGGVRKTGAARLAARAALRIGAGLVTLGAPPAAQMEIASQITALMLKRVDGAGDLLETLQDERFNALCLGPGLGETRSRELVPVALSAARPTVLDADALSAFAEEPAALLELLHERCVLTPHTGEFARLFPDIAEKLNEVPAKGPAFSKVDAAREAAVRAGCCVLVKGPDTVIATLDGRCSVNSAHYNRAAPWLATAGSGDTLAGFITGLLARGFEPMQAAETAAWLHVECARNFGPGLIAEDLAEQLPAVLQQIEV